jgi:hypothetical protein
MFEIRHAPNKEFCKKYFLARGYRIKILLHCDFFRYDALRYSPIYA